MDGMRWPPVALLGLLHDSRTDRTNEMGAFSVGVVCCVDAVSQLGTGLGVMVAHEEQIGLKVLVGFIYHGLLDDAIFGVLIDLFLKEQPRVAAETENADDETGPEDELQARKEKDEKGQSVVEDGGAYIEQHHAAQFQLLLEVVAKGGGRPVVAGPARPPRALRRRRVRVPASLLADAHLARLLLLLLFDAQQVEDGG